MKDLYIIYANFVEPNVMFPAILDFRDIIANKSGGSSMLLCQ